MPSTNKTANLELNQWIGTDKPKMADFNADNSLIDAAIGDLQSDMQDAEATLGNFYTKQESDNRFANSVKKTSSGATINLTDVQDGAQFAALSVDGKTVETGTGTRSPDNPFALTGVGESGEISIVISDGTNSRTVNIPAPIPLYSTPSAKDTINAIDGIIKRNTIKIVLDGVTNSGGTLGVATNELTNTIRFFYRNSAIQTGQITSITAISDRLISVTDTFNQDYECFANSLNNGDMLFRLLKSRGVTDLSTLLTWLQSNPITFIVPRSTPTIESITPQEIPLYAPSSTVASTDAAGPVLNITYNRDLNAVIAELQAAIVALGGI